MSLYQRYRDHLRNFQLEQNSCINAINIFRDSAGERVVERNLVGKNKVDKYITISKEMKTGLETIFLHIRSITVSSHPQFKSTFYITQYGGSKTQFIHYCIDKIGIEFNKVIATVIPSLDDLHPKFLAELIVPQTIKHLATFSDMDDDEFKVFFNQAQDIIQKFNEISSVGDLREEFILEVEKIGDELGNKRKMKKLEELIEKIPLVDTELQLRIVIKFLEFVTKYDLRYIFFLDEIDLWFSEDSSEFSEKFNAKNRLIKLFLELGNYIPVIFVFCCSNRITATLSSIETINNQAKSSPAASRFITIFQGSEKCIEPGMYEDDFDEAFLRLTSIFAIAENSNFDKTFIEEIIPIFRYKYRHFSRRVANSRIIRILNTYHVLSKEIEQGLKEMQYVASWGKIGSIVQNLLPQVLKSLDFRFIREEIDIDPTKQFTNKKMDGYFLTGRPEEKKVFTEIKCTTSEKYDFRLASQVIDSIKFQPNRVIQIIFGKTKISKEDMIHFITSKILESPDTDVKEVKRFHPIIITNEYALAPLAALTDLSRPTEVSEKIKNIAIWFDELTSIRHKLQEILLEDIITEKPEIKVSPIVKSARNLIIEIKRRKEMSPTGIKSKASIEKIASDIGMGISDDIPAIYDLWERREILEKRTRAQIRFSKRILEKIKALNLQEFEEIIQEIIKD